MFPTILEGDLIIYRSTKALKYKPIEGSIVIAKHPLKKDLLIVKRVLKVSKFGIDLRGDNALASSDSNKFGLIPSKFIIGLVECIIPLSQ